MLVYWGSVRFHLSPATLCLGGLRQIAVSWAIYVLVRKVRYTVSNTTQNWIMFLYEWGYSINSSNFLTFLFAVSEMRLRTALPCGTSLPYIVISFRQIQKNLLVVDLENRNITLPHMTSHFNPHQMTTLLVPYTLNINYCVHGSIPSSHAMTEVLKF